MNVLKEKCFFYRKILVLEGKIVSLSSVYCVSFFFLLCLGLRHCKSGFLILKICQYGGPRRLVQLFLKYLCKNISISVGPMTTKFSKQVHVEELTQMRLTKQVLVTSSCEKLKPLYLHHRDRYDHQH